MNGVHTDGRLSVVISGIGAADEGTADTFHWWADRPVALVIIRSGSDGDDVSLSIGPIRWGTAARPPADPGGISYVAFAYDTDVETSAAPPSRSSAAPAASILARLLRSGSPA